MVQISKEDRLNILKETVEFFIENNKFPEIEFNKVVLYDGNPCAEIMVIARDLGQREVELEKPLIGPAGSLFREIAVRLGFNPVEDFFMCNTVPLKPIKNIAFSEKVRNDMRWVLNELINIVQPSVFLTLGKEATEWFGLQVNRMKDFVGKETILGDKLILPSYHPSYLNRLKNKGINVDSEMEKIFSIVGSIHDK